MGFPAPGVGSSLGRYQLLEEIGRGAMGIVFAAYDPQLDRKVAIKVIAPGILATDTARKRFRNEALALSRLNHRNIQTVHDFGSEGEADFLVCELIDGTSLDSKISVSRLAPEQIIELGAQLAAALQAAHQQGVIHRDLKPANLRLTRDGQLKVLDFGLAQLASQNGMDDETASRMDICGTLPYMAPEILEGRPASAASDIYSAGVVLYEFATGRRPHSGSGSALINSILHEQPASASSLNAALPPALEPIIGKAMDKDARYRYRSAGDLEVDLQRLRRGSSASVAIPKSGRMARTHLAVPVGAAVALLVAASVMGVRMLRSGGASLQRPVRSLAVIPLQNLSADSSQQYFAQAMTEQLTTELASLRSVQVISGAAAGHYDAGKTTPSQIARQLGIDAVLEGSVLRTADRVRVSLELIDGSSERHLWSGSYDRAADGAIGIERQVARAIADQLHLQLSAADQQRLQTPVTRNPEAYNAYLQAQFHLQQSFKRVEETDKAVRMAEEAVKLDPDFAEAYVTLASASEVRIFYWQGGNEFLEKGLVAVEKALVLNPDLADAYWVRGELHYNQLHGFDLLKSIPDYRRAIALNPNFADAHHALGGQLTHLGLHEEAIEEFHTALRLDPDSFGAKMRLGRALWQSNRFEEALASYERFNVIDFERSIVLAYLGRRPEAAEMLKAVNAAGTRANDQADLHATAAFLLALDGKQNRPRIDREMAQAERLGIGKDHFHHAAFVMAAAYAELGDVDSAMKWLRYVADHGMPNYPLFRDNPSTRKMRGDPRYDRFMQELQARWNEIVANTGNSADTRSAG